MTNELHNVAAAEKPHTEITGLLQQLGTTPTPILSSLSPEGARRFSKQIFPTADNPEPVKEIMELSITGEGIPIRVYVPVGGGPYPTLVYLHGGGWVIGDTDMYDATCRAITNAANCMVVSVDYRLAPEHKFPIPLEDCYAAAEWVFDTAEMMLVDTDNVAIGGDSAGGNMAAAVAQMARNRDGPSFARQILIYPVTDHEFDTPSYGENAEGYLLTKADMEWFWDQYLRDDIDGRNPYASPLKAQDLQELPPATIVTCGFDPLRDEGAAYAGQLEDAGVDVNHIHYDDAIHGIAQLLVEPMDLTRARDLINDVGEDLQAPFNYLLATTSTMTEIVEATDTFTLVILFKTVPEHQHELVDIVTEETREWIRELPGFVSANLHTSTDGTRVVNYGQWESADTWEEFNNDPRTDRLRERIDNIEGVELVEANDYIVDGVFR